MKIVAIVMIATLMLISINYAYAQPIDTYKLESSTSIIEPSIFKVEPEIVKAKEVVIDNIDNNKNDYTLFIIGIVISVGIASIFVGRKSIRLSGIIFIMLLSLLMPVYAESVEVKDWDLSDYGADFMYRFVVDSQGRIWFYSSIELGRGIGYLDPSTNEVRLYLFGPSFGINRMYINQNDDLWLVESGFSPSIMKFNMETGNLEVWTSSLLGSIGIHSININSFDVDNNGNAYFRYSEKLIRLDPSTNEVTYWNIQTSPSDSTLSVDVDSDHVYLAAPIQEDNFDTLFIRLDPSTNEVTYWRYLSGLVVSSPSVVNQGNLYFTSRDDNNIRYLMRFIPSQNTVEILYQTSPYDRIQGILFDKSNRIWLLNSYSGEYHIINLGEYEALVYSKENYNDVYATIDKTHNKLYIGVDRLNGSLSIHLQQYDISD